MATERMERLKAAYAKADAAEGEARAALKELVRPGNWIWYNHGLHTIEVKVVEVVGLAGKVKVQSSRSGQKYWLNARRIRDIF